MIFSNHAQGPSRNNRRDRRGRGALRRARPARLLLTSFDRFRHVPDDGLVLPSHNLPFHGRHDRLDAITDHHRGRLEACAIPRTVVELIAAIFSRRLDSMQTAFALGETLAHAKYLVGDGELAREVSADEVFRFTNVT